NIAAASIWSARRRLLSEAGGRPEFLEQRITHGVEVEPVLGDQRTRLDNDVVDILDHLQSFVEVLAFEAEPFPEDLHEIDNLEAAPIANIAELAVAGMVNRGKGCDTCVRNGSELARDELALERRQYCETIGLRPDTRHIDLDELDAGNDREQLAHRRLHRRQ